MYPDDVNVKILHATQTNDLDTIQKYRSVSWGKVRYDKTGDTVLHVAARLGYADLLKYFLETASPDVKNKDDKTPLHEAAQFSRSDIVNILLEHGAEVNALKRSDWTPLMLACTKLTDSSYKCVELLLQNRALINAENKDGWSALHLISREGCEEIFKLLCKYGLDVFAVTKNGRSALHIASLHGNLDIVKMLLHLGLPVDNVDNCGNTPLHESVLGSSLSVFHCLLSSDADLHAVNNIGCSAMHLAASVGCLPIIRYLAQNSIDVNSASFTNKLTPLHYAARKRQRKAVDLLKQLGANEVMDNFGRSGKRNDGRATNSTLVIQAATAQTTITNDDLLNVQVKTCEQLYPPYWTPVQCTIFFDRSIRGAEVRLAADSESASIQTSHLLRKPRKCPTPLR
ncbi:hypothetical protein FQR65_LT00150 [Abscondita terminalis]|nr:hypothetical protein FQR65_LT00150 [Abscondita terminalis]